MSSPATSALPLWDSYYGNSYAVDDPFGNMAQNAGATMSSTVSDYTYNWGPEAVGKTFQVTFMWTGTDGVSQDRFWLFDVETGCTLQTYLQGSTADQWCYYGSSASVASPQGGASVFGCHNLVGIFSVASLGASFTLQHAGAQNVYTSTLACSCIITEVDPAFRN